MNQKALYKQIREVHKREKPLDVYEEPLSKAHGRLERRRCEVFDAGGILKKWNAEWPYVRTIIKVTRHREVIRPQSVPTTEVSYYLTNASHHEAETYAKVIRQHWGIENLSNHVRDVAFREDAGIRRVNPGIFSRLISLAYNNMSASGTSNFRESLYKNTLCFNQLMDSLVCF